MGENTTSNGQLPMDANNHYLKEKAFLMEEKNGTEKVPRTRVRTSSHSKQTWWKRRTFLEKGLLIMFILMAIVTVIAVVMATTTVHKVLSSNNASTDPSVCTSADCVRTAARVLEAMDATADPCDDFFQYACGTWNSKNIIPDDRSNFNTFGKLRDDIKVALKSLLEEDVKENEPEVIQIVKLVYSSCLNMSHIDERGDAPLRTLIDWLGGWPVIDPDWNEDNFDWLEVIAKLRLLNNRVIINQWVSADDKNSHVNIIQLDQTHLGMPSRDYFLKGRDDKILRGYETFAKDVAIIMGASEEEAELQMTDVIDFEIKLANITMADEDRRDTEAIYHKFKISELYSNVTQDIDWLRYLNLVFSNVSMSVDMNEEIVLYTPQYMQKLGVLVKQTSKRTFANYLVWFAIYQAYKHDPFPRDLHTAKSRFNNVLYGTDSERSRWKVCVSYTNDNFGMAVGRLFVEEHYQDEAKSTAEEMIQNIRESFSELLESVEWMDDETRAKAKEKADAMQEKIGYPNYILNDTALLEDYEGVVIDPGKYFENVLSNLNAVTRNNLKSLHDPVDKTKWSTTPAVVNAFYSAAKNQIMFPAGILQPPFYSDIYPKSLNFGGIAMVIGHEMTHGFDDRGRQFDKDGNLLQWWSNDVIKKFKSRAQCIINQYGNYTIDEVNMNLNGKQTQGENIADNGGLKQSFKAYRNWVEQRGSEEQPLPGLDLSHNQLFFLNFAQIWCGSARPESYIQAIRSGSHSPGKFRVIGALSNSYDFAEAFSCPVGARMNPRQKCAVW